MSVRDILGVQAVQKEGKSLKSLFKGSAPKEKTKTGRKKGPSKELEALTQQFFGGGVSDDSGDETAPRPYIGVHISQKLKNQRHVVCGKWERKLIVDNAFEDKTYNPNLVLYGYEKVGPQDEPDYFECGGRPETHRFEPSQYQQYYSKLDKSWNLRDTQALFDICDKVGLRFHVVYDRWLSDRRSPPLRTCTIEDLKKRYYAVAKISVEREFAAKISKRPGEKQMLTHECSKHKMVKFSYDKETELKRKDQLRKQYEATNSSKQHASYLKDCLEVVDARIFKERQYLSENKRLTAPLVSLSTRKSEAIFGKSGGVYSSYKLLGIGPWSSMVGASETDRKRVQRLNDYLTNLEGDTKVDVKALKNKPTKRCLDAWGAIGVDQIRLKQLQEGIERRKKDLAQFNESTARYEERQQRRMQARRQSAAMPSPSASPIRMRASPEPSPLPSPSPEPSPSPSPPPKRARRK